jgi:hypothetical protein
VVNEIFKTAVRLLLYMGIFSKLKFWKKEDEFDFDALASKEMAKDFPSMEQQPSTPPIGEKSPFEELDRRSDPFASQPESIAPSLAPQSTQQPGNKRDMELMNSKLDTIKALLQSLDQRLANLEKGSGSQDRKRLW